MSNQFCSIQTGAAPGTAATHQPPPTWTDVRHHAFGLPIAGNKSTKARKKEKLLVTICARLSIPKFRTLDVWCDNSFRKRSEVVGMVLERVLDLIEQEARSEQPVEDFIRHLHVDSSA